MNTDIFEGKWEEIKGRLKQAWAKLTDDDCLAIEGNHQEIYGALQKHYGYTKEEAKKSVDNFLGR
ncbi:CsbD family protein [Legionella saoudiensis]|uniref:CsbD family protein n=1 Tax=Legionella saoudiensis TaxID=1750561 RepID=UPI00072FD04C|nr:CsbD family protein [Legionella saoudiensis]